MANIPVERTSSFPWWLLVLGALVLGAILWLLLRGGDDADGTGTVAVEQTDPAAGAVGAAGSAGAAPGAAGSGDAITSIDQLRELRGTRQLYGREVALASVDAVEIAGDSTFFIADGQGGTRLLVVLEEVGEGESAAAGPEGSDGRYDVDQGDVLAIYGRVDRFTGSERAVAGANASRLLPDSLYIRATRVEAASAGTDVRTPGS